MSTAIPIAEQLYVGLYCSDCACQTEQDEILQLKSTTKLLKNLYREVEWLKSELTFTRDSLRSSFYDELQANGQAIYYQLTDKLDVLRKNHSKALETLRLSYRSQLHDFISQARSIMNSDKPTIIETVTSKQKRSGSENPDKSFFHQAAIKGYETEIANLKKEIEQLHEATQHEIKLATNFLSDEKDRLNSELAIVNRTLAQCEDSLMKKDEQIRDLKRDIGVVQSKLKESKKVTLREPTITPVTQSRLAQTDAWIPSPMNDKSGDDSNNEFQTMMQTKVEALEQKYQTIIEQKNAQIQQLIQEADTQQKTFKTKMERYVTMEERHRNDMKRHAEKHKQDMQIWETKYDILKKSMTVLRDEMYTRQTHIRDRFTAKPAVVTYN